MFKTIKRWSAIGPITYWLSPPEMDERVHHGGVPVELSWPPGLAPSDINNFWRRNLGRNIENVVQRRCRIGKITLKTAA